MHACHYAFIILFEYFDDTGGRAVDQWGRGDGGAGGCPGAVGAPPGCAGPVGALGPWGHDGAVELCGLHCGWSWVVVPFFLVFFVLSLIVSFLLVLFRSLLLCLVLYLYVPMFLVLPRSFSVCPALACFVSFFLGLSRSNW